MPSIERITLLVAGRQYTGLKDIAVGAGYDHAARSFHFEPAPGAASLKVFAPGTPIDIMFNADLACRGYIDRLKPGLSKLTVSGRSKAQDFIDCAAIDQNGTGNFENQTLLQIAQALDRFKVGIATDQQLEPIESYQITPGEKAFAAIEKLARDQGLTLSAQPDGSIRITKPGSTRHAGGLFEGVNMLKGAEADLDWAHRHSTVIVRGQAADGTDDTDLQVEATADDSAVGRYRPYVHIEDSDCDQETAQDLANARLAREAGNSLKCTVPVQGFRDEAGTLWTPGNLVWTESPTMGLAQDMLIRHTAFKRSRRGGATTMLSLVDPRAFGGKKSKGSSADDAWDMDVED
jgi:prophage tail gpP-like protein